MQKVLIESNIPLVDAVTAWLRDKARLTPSGVPALDHLLLLVPTRQAGRRLRESLAGCFPSGCLAPRTMLPSQFLEPAADPARPVAAGSELTSLLCGLLLDLDFSHYPALFPEKGRPVGRTFAWALAQADQLLDIWKTLGEAALTISDVAQRIETLLEGEDLDVEVARWQDLARIESELFRRIEQTGLTPPPLALRRRIAAPAVPAGCEEIVLPALVDGIPALYAALQNLGDSLPVTLLIHADHALACGFDSSGVPDPAFWLSAAAPRTDIPEHRIEQHADSASQAAGAAACFAAIPADEELPALGMVDPDLFRELHSAFQPHGFSLHNPAGFPLRNSSLARLIQQIINFSADTPFTILAAFIRQDDTVRWLQQRQGLNSRNYALMLQALDELQNRHLPQTAGQVLEFSRSEISEIAAKERPYPDESVRRQGLEHLVRTLDCLLRLTACDRGQSRLERVVAVLKELFSVRTLSDEYRKDRELSAAARRTLEIIDAIDTPVTAQILTPEQRDELFDHMLRSGTYQLEPPPGCVIQTEGWLELPWNPAAEMVVTGFNEGCVPASLVGHPFLPDSLRRKLGLPHNDLKTARDASILHSLVNSRAPGAIRFLLERANTAGDVRKPSRLLFLCEDTTLAERAARLFSEGEQAPRNSAKSLPDRWRFNPPVPAPAACPRSLSATRAGRYLQCPFSFYLSDILQMQPADDRAVEIDSMTLGNICHHAIESFSLSPLHTSTDPDEIAAALGAAAEDEITRLYGDQPPAVILLQLNAVRQRLRNFAALQAERTAAGWTIRAVEERFSRDFGGIEIVGKVDRVDYHPSTDTLQVIDFKTWDRLGDSNGLKRYLSTSAADIEYAVNRGFNSFEIADTRGKPAILTDMQLPLYLLLLPESCRETEQTAVECGYWVLGDSPETTLCACRDFSELRPHALETITRIVSNLKAGIFWPPSPRELWRNDFEKLFLESPLEMNRSWITDQEARIARICRSPMAM